MVSFFLSFFLFIIIIPITLISNTLTMGYTTPRWIRVWLTLSSFVVLWDAGYCFNRPRSMRGGDLSWIWAPYK